MLQMGWSSEFWADPLLSLLSREFAGVFLAPLFPLTVVVACGSLLRHIGGFNCLTFLFLELEPVKSFGLVWVLFLVPGGLPGLRRCSGWSFWFTSDSCGGEGPNLSRAGILFGLSGVV